jgi:hypothetical protein
VKRKLKAVETEEIEDDRVTATGLCSTCSNARWCTTIRGKRNMKVMYCEQFDDYEPPRPKLAALQSNRDDLLYDDDPARKRSRGLCVTCSRFATCTFIKPEGGVWHCEEYE